MQPRKNKNALITKRTGLDRIRRAVSGYRVYLPGMESRNFATLRDARAYVDAMFMEAR